VSAPPPPEAFRSAGRAGPRGSGLRAPDRSEEREIRPFVEATIALGAGSRLAGGGAGPLVPWQRALRGGLDWGNVVGSGLWAEDEDSDFEGIWGRILGLVEPGEHRMGRGGKSGVDLEVAGCRF
jgi:hypothetical protein